jgi:hypothetical protein
MHIKRVGYFRYDRMKSWCEGRTVRQNDYLAVSLVGEGEPLLVVWFMDNSTFVAFVARFRGLWDSRKLK